jgi:hypothetical protein
MNNIEHTSNINLPSSACLGINMGPTHKAGEFTTEAEAATKLRRQPGRIKRASTVPARRVHGQLRTRVNCVFSGIFQHDPLACVYLSIQF